MSGSERGKPRCEEGPGICSVLLTVLSILLVIATLPLSLFFIVKVVQVGGPVVSPDSRGGKVSALCMEIVANM